MSQSAPFFTIGHSNRSLDGFIDLLHHAKIDQVVDVRKMPGSRSNPQFNEDALSEALPTAAIGYQHAADLGGLRTASTDIAPSTNGYWRNRSFHNYADYALSSQFRTALARLRTYGANQRVTIMCAEAVWWRCHRRIIADHLLGHGERVFHVMGNQRIDSAKLTAGAAVAADGSVTYPL